MKSNKIKGVITLIISVICLTSCTKIDRDCPKNDNGLKNRPSDCIKMSILSGENYECADNYILKNADSLIWENCYIEKDNFKYDVDFIWLVDSIPFSATYNRPQKKCTLVFFDDDSVSITNIKFNAHSTSFMITDEMGTHVKFVLEYPNRLDFWGALVCYSNGADLSSCTSLPTKWVRELISKIVQVIKDAIDRKLECARQLGEHEAICAQNGCFPVRTVNAVFCTFYGDPDKAEKCHGYNYVCNYGENK